MISQKTNKDQNFFLNFSKVSIWTMVSRFFGFVRDIMMAYFLGTSIIAEAFIIAFSIPNLFRRIFAEGAFTTAFLPILSKKINNKKELSKFSSETFSILLFSLIFLTVIAEIFMPILIFSTAGGFLESEKFYLSTLYARIMFPYIILISLSTFFGSILNSINKFTITSSLPVVLNIVIILSMIFANIFKKDIGICIVISVPIAGLIQLISLWYSVKLNQHDISFKLPKLTKDIKFLIKIAIPTTLSAGVIQINLLVGRQIASFYDGAIAWLTYADRIYQLPLAVIGIAMGTVLLPKLSKKIFKKDFEGGQKLIIKSLLVCILFSVPATVALILIPFKIIEILFERGEFLKLDTIATGNALWIYALGLPSFILQKIFSTIFFAESNTKTPFKCALVAMILNVLISILLIPKFGYLSPAIGISISGWVMCLLLFLNLKIIRIQINKYFKLQIIRIFISSIIMGIFIIFFENVTYELGSSIEIMKYFLFFLLILFSICIYFLSLKILGFFRENL